jgi:hypothetical protein
MLKLNSSNNRIEAVRQFVHTMCLFCFQNVTGRELDLLCEVLRCGGVNDKSKKSFMINYKTTKENYGQLVKRLSDKGIFVDLNARNGKRLHENFENLLTMYLNNDSKSILMLEWKAKE